MMCASASTANARVIGKWTTRHCLTTSKVRLSLYRRSSSSSGDRPCVAQALLAAVEPLARALQQVLAGQSAPDIDQHRRTTASQPRMALKWMPAWTSTSSEPAQAMRSCRRSSWPACPS